MKERRSKGRERTITSNCIVKIPLKSTNVFKWFLMFPFKQEFPCITFLPLDDNTHVLMNVIYIYIYIYIKMVVVGPKKK